jgi:hypothetical protein
MAEAEIRDYAKEKAFHRQTLERWLNWEPAARDALGAIALNLKISENHLRDMMDWLEEIALRDHVKVDQILAAKMIEDVATDPRLGRADKLKRIKEQLRRQRYPRLAETEDQLRDRIHALQLPGAIRLSVAPGLEGGRLNVEFSAASAAEFKALALKLGEAASTSPVAEIFALLAGEPKDKERG